MHCFLKLRLCFIFPFKGWNSSSPKSQRCLIISNQKQNYSFLGKWSDSKYEKGEGWFYQNRLKSNSDFDVCDNWICKLSPKIEIRLKSCGGRRGGGGGGVSLTYPFTILIIVFFVLKWFLTKLITFLAKVDQCLQFLHENHF